MSRRNKSHVFPTKPRNKIRTKRKPQCSADQGKPCVTENATENDDDRGPSSADSPTEQSDLFLPLVANLLLLHDSTDRAMKTKKLSIPIELSKAKFCGEASERCKMVIDILTKTVQELGDMSASFAEWSKGPAHNDDPIALLASALPFELLSQIRLVQLLATSVQEMMHILGGEAPQHQASEYLEVEGWLKSLFDDKFVLRCQDIQRNAKSAMCTQLMKAIALSGLLSVRATKNPKCVVHRGLIRLILTAEPDMVDMIFSGYARAQDPEQVTTQHPIQKRDKEGLALVSREQRPPAARSIHDTESRSSMSMSLIPVLGQVSFVEQINQKTRLEFCQREKTKTRPALNDSVLHITEQTCARALTTDLRPRWVFEDVDIYDMWRYIFPLAGVRCDTTRLSWTEFVRVVGAAPLRFKASQNTGGIGYQFTRLSSAEHGQMRFGLHMPHGKRSADRGFWQDVRKMLNRRFGWIPEDFELRGDTETS